MSPQGFPGGRSGCVARAARKAAGALGVKRRRQVRAEVARFAAGLPERSSPGKEGRERPKPPAEFACFGGVPRGDTPTKHPSNSALKISDRFLASKKP